MKNKIFIAQLTSLNLSVKRIQTSRSIWGEYIRQICTVYRTISLFSFTFAEEPREFLARKQLIWAININHHHMGFPVRGDKPVIFSCRFWESFQVAMFTTLFR